MTLILANYFFPFNLSGPEFLIFFIGLTSVGIIAALITRARTRSKSSQNIFNINNDHQNQLHPLEIAMLAGGKDQAIQATLVGLKQKNTIEFYDTGKTKNKTELERTEKGFELKKGKSLRTSNPIPSDATPLEKIIYITIGKGIANSYYDMKSAATIELHHIQTKLENQGYLETSKSFRPARYYPFMIMLLILTCGTYKLYIGISISKPILYLLLLNFLTAFISVLFLRMPRYTIQGKKTLAKLKVEHKNLRKRAKKDNDLTTDEAMLGVGIFGIIMFNYSDYKIIYDALPINVRSASTMTSLGYGDAALHTSSSAGCGGDGCGGGGCGGGCGGCGD